MKIHLFKTAQGEPPTHMIAVPETANQFGYHIRDGCPCCNAPLEQSRPSVASEPPAETMPPDAHGAFLSGYAASRLFFTYARCSGCGARYCPTYYSQEQLDRLYSRQAENMSEAPLDARLRTQSRYVRLLMQHSSRADDFLEIGADNGSFAQSCAAMATFRHFWLHEPNVEVHPTIAERMKGYSYTAIAGRFNAGNIGRETVSTAAMIHVLDHLLDPLRMLREMFEVLQPNGVLLIVTHDSSSLMARTLGKRWPPYTLQHPQLYTPNALSVLLSRAGFDSTHVEKTLNYFPLFYFASAACSVLGIRTSVFPKDKGPLLGLKLGNIAFVARKPARVPSPE